MYGKMHIICMLKLLYYIICMANICISYASQSQFLHINSMQNIKKNCAIDTHFHDSELTNPTRLIGETCL